MKFIRFSILLFYLGLLQACSNNFKGNTYVYEVLDSEGKSFEQIFIHSGDIAYVERVSGDEIIEREWITGDTSIMVRHDSAGYQYTVLNSGFNKFRRLRQYSHISTANSKKAFSNGKMAKRIFLTRENGKIEMLIDESRGSVIPDFPDVEFLALKVDWSLSDRHETWELSNAFFSDVPTISIDTSAEYVFPEVWLVDPQVGTPQNDNYKLDFEVSDFETGNSLNDFQIEVTRNDSIYVEVRADSSQTSIFLPLGHAYSIKLNAPGYLGKSIWMDMTQVSPEDAEGGFLSELNFVLFKNQDGFDKALLEEPIGKASYNRDIHAFEWDFDYTKKRQELINQSLQAH